VRICRGRRFRADGAATEKELFESWRLDRGTIKSPQVQIRGKLNTFMNKVCTKFLLQWLTSVVVRVTEKNKLVMVLYESNRSCTGTIMVGLRL